MKSWTIGYIAGSLGVFSGFYHAFHFSFMESVGFLCFWIAFLMTVAIIKQMFDL
jgi:hypothetical protein